MGGEAEIGYEDGGAVGLITDCFSWFDVLYSVYGIYTV